LGNWRRIDAERMQRCGIFDLDRVRFDPGDGRPEQRFWIIEAPHWINVIPLTPEGRVLMVEQYRYGIEGDTLEIPGGMCDPGESPLTAARRELLEETGYESDSWEELGWVHPNPAVQSNRCYTFLARDARKVAEPKPDTNESFVQHSYPLEQVPRLIAERRISHALVVAAFRLLDRDRL
jgi:8-oxo-dGTP pyrophosphatase MutT (NUDIX family)